VIREGRYRAYGQNLAISDGQLIFQGPPDNPGLDIRAIRKIPSENVVVGVQLSGTLQEPEASLFSEPGMEQSQAMSYLLTGRSLERGSKGDNNQIAQALALYGLEKGSGVTEKLGDKLGVDEISVGSDWETDDAALMLGKQLSDRLYLTYAVGLFDAVSTVMLRYTLTRQLHLEARSSTRANSLDLIWEKELQ
jgi:translocation and assembly module TamB